MAFFARCWGRVAPHASRTRRRNSTFAKTVIVPDAQLDKALRQGVEAYAICQNPVSRPPLHLPPLPLAVLHQLEIWSQESEAEAEAASDGMKAYSYSLPLLVASQLGHSDRAKMLLSRMSCHLEAEFASGEVSPSFHAWMLGRLLLASSQCNNSAAVVTFERSLSNVLDAIIAERVSRDPEKIEHVDDPFEAWAWAYLLSHYGGEDVQDATNWLKATRMLWAAMEGTAGRVNIASQHGDRMWVNTLALCALSIQPTSGTVVASPDPLSKTSMLQMYEDAFFLFRYKSEAASDEGAVDFDTVIANQISSADALRQIPSSDFRSWAVGLVRSADAQANCPLLQSGDLDEVFLEAMQNSTSPGDRALGATNWLYALYVARWRSLTCDVGK